MTNIPATVQVAVPGSSRPPQISFRSTSVLRFEVRTFELGLSSVEAARLRHRFGEPARPTSTCRAVPVGPQHYSSSSNER
jgi:hypothetical protein